uniref:Uncharacterized protein n=1 Tax=Romanomermis culicivorax TaxID=13658 RepID=A0A915IH96_ROMCU
MTKKVICMKFMQIRRYLQYKKFHFGDHIRLIRTARHAQFNVSFPVNHRNLKCRDVDEFLCRCSDVCIPRSKWQDGNIDCPDGTDEGCPAHFFVCADHSDCIDPIKYLDGNRDCADGSDEPCSPTSLLCRDGMKCISSTKFQDGVNDCLDGSDEEGEELDNKKEMRESRDKRLKRKNIHKRKYKQHTQKTKEEKTIIRL